MEVMQHVLVSTSSGDPYKELWRRIWKAKVPGKVSICVWRACSNLLPTRDRLLTKGYTGELHCVLCPHGIEDVSHLFCKCPIALDVLSGPPFNLQNEFSQASNFKYWMLERALTLSSEVFAKLLMIVWAVWQKRNSFLWNGTKETTQNILLSSFAWLDEFQKARNTTVHTMKQPQRHWRPATAGVLKMNVDEAYLPNQARGSVGGVLRTDAGHFVAAFARPIPHTASPEQCELYAIRSEFDLLNSLQVQHVVIESDCIEAITEASCLDHSLLANRGLVDDIKCVMALIPQVKLCYAPRSCNMVAHRLAGIGFEANHHMVWPDHTPECILDVFQYDCNHLT